MTMKLRKAGSVHKPSATKPYACATRMEAPATDIDFLSAITENICKKCFKHGVYTLLTLEATQTDPLASQSGLMSRYETYVANAHMGDGIDRTTGERLLTFVEWLNK